ncbi:hypothetical protein KFE98_17320 [bacterium SCSIO 12741]|nr:hypothetical protein KFE98_17320 [bacterium SCSIO 12741]
MGTYGGGVLRRKAPELDRETLKAPVYFDFESLMELWRHWKICNPAGVDGWEQAKVNRIDTSSDEFVADVHLNESVLVSRNFEEPVEWSALDELEPPILDMSQQKDPYLTFDYAYARKKERNPGYRDTFDLQYSLDDGRHWHLLWGKRGSHLYTAEATEKRFVPKTGDWKTIVIPFPQGTGKKRVLFKFSTYGPKMTNDLWFDKFGVGDIKRDILRIHDGTWPTEVLPQTP